MRRISQGFGFPLITHDSIRFGQQECLLPNETLVA
jgi:hypothetical protein